LRKGLNVVLVKISQGGGAWGFCVRVAGLSTPIQALRPNELRRAAGKSK